MEYLFSSRMESLPFSEIRRMMEQANHLEKGGERIIHLELGRPDFDTPQFIKDACQKSLENGNVFYTSNYGMQPLREAINQKLIAENGLQYTAEEILVTVGLSEAVYCALGALLNPGDEVLVPNPVWLNYIHVPRFFGSVPVSYHLREENGFQIDPDELRAAISPRTRMIVLISPNNPTGSVASRTVLEAVAAIAREYDLIVLADEIYEKMIYEERQKHLSIGALPGMLERTITLNGFSKAYSMTGWRLGYLAAPAPILQTVVRMHQYITTCAPSFVQEAGITALRQGNAHVTQMVEEYHRRRDLVVSGVNAIPGLRLHKPDGAFYAFVNIKELGISSQEAAEYFLHNAGVAMVPGSAFGSGGEGYLRLSFASGMQVLAEAMEQIAAAAAQCKKR